ncbi:potassium:proton antiporter [Acinetobacter sp. NCu2D-2]|uniref:cation:proton antiporter domain-containing protein n=1 Tax=Acinetobacter sp. NCu2D-2 TaxID=1608473 RepID=UPI0007CDF3A6|nr:cation:proton antiporter [Acinetobacter sp. NCu2D-2]ANF80908.1 potassium:proton antiporter [Acinetobacter sp. NCu2D-2]
MSVLLQMTLILALALVVVPLCKRLNIPTVLGYILTGLFAGSSALNLFTDNAIQLQFTQISLFLLLFWLGLQLRTTRLTQIKQNLWMTALILSCVSTSIFAGLSYLFISPVLSTSLAIGLAGSFSSTALVLQHLKQHDQLTTTHGQLSYAVLTIQILLSIPCIAVIPLLAGIPSTEHGVAYSAVILMVFTGLFLANRYIFQPLYIWIAKSGSHELHLLVALFVSLGLYSLMNLLGIHYLLAAIFAGILLADSDFRPAIESSIQPFLGLFIGLSFIALGLHISIDNLLTDAVFIAAGVAILVSVKFIIAMILARFYQHTWRNSSLFAASMAQAGELSFIVLMIALMEGSIEKAWISPLLLILSISMLITPVLYWLLDRHILPRLDRQNHLLATFDTDSSPQVQTPILLIGFGRFGQIIGRILHQQQQPFSVMDNNLAATHLLAQFNIPFYQADATEPEALHQVNLSHTEKVIIAIDDIEDSMLVVRHLTWNYPDLQLWVRARDRHHAQLLQDLGIEHIWRETYQSALSMAQHVLHSLGIENDELQHTLARFTDHDIDLLKSEQAIAPTSAGVLSELEYLLTQDQKQFHAKRTEPQQDNNGIELDVIRDDLS